MIFKKWLWSLVFLVLAFVLMANVIISLVYVAAKLYLYIVRDIPLGTYLPGFFRVIKGASFGGMIAGIGCWYVSFKNRKY